MTERLAQLQRLKGTGELTLYPWLSQNCRRRAVSRYDTSFAGFVELIPGVGTVFEFEDVEVRSAQSGRAITSSIDPNSANSVDGLRASEWIYQNGNWQYDSCNSGQAPIPEGFDQDAATLGELHTAFDAAINASEGPAYNGIPLRGLDPNGTSLTSPGISQTFRYWIVNPTTEAAANELVLANVLPVIEPIGYSYQGVVKSTAFEGDMVDAHRFTLDADECGVLDAQVVWPTTTAAPEIRLELSRAC